MRLFARPNCGFLCHLRPICWLESLRENRGVRLLSPLIDNSASTHSRDWDKSLALPAAGAGAAETVETAAVPMEVEAVSVCAQPVRLQSVNLLSGLLPSSLLPRALAPSAPSTPLSGQLSYLVAVSTPLGAATAQAAPLPAAAAAEVRKDWTELEDEEILRRHAPRATRHAPRATRHAP